MDVIDPKRRFKEQKFHYLPDQSCAVNTDEIIREPIDPIR